MSQAVTLKPRGRHKHKHTSKRHRFIYLRFFDKHYKDIENIACEWYSGWLWFGKRFKNIHNVKAALARREWANIHFHIYMVHARCRGCCWVCEELWKSGFVTLAFGLMSVVAVECTRHQGRVRSTERVTFFRPSLGSCRNGMGLTDLKRIKLRLKGTLLGQMSDHQRESLSSDRGSDITELEWNWS